MNLTGQLLIAPPTMKDRFWHKTVVLVTENHLRGSLGIIVNKITNLSVNDFTRQLNEECMLPGHIYAGGPVNTNAMTMLHSNDWECENTLKITGDIGLSSHKDIIKILAMGSCPRYWRIMLGLCVWQPNQLESELAGKHGYDHNQSWLLASSDLETIFEGDTKYCWTQAIERSSSEFVQKILD